MSYPQPQPLTERQARYAYRLLHYHVRNGYERGDCHCDACVIIVDDLRDFFGFTPLGHSDPRTGVFDPASLIRAAAQKRGWP